MTKFFGDIVIQSKDDKEDFRAFCHCIDSKDKAWELRGYGKTAGEAAQEAWNIYHDDECNWDLHGEIVQ